jgi:hypothetical protein
MNNPYKYRGSRDVLHLLKYVLFRRRRVSGEKIGKLRGFLG